MNHSILNIIYNFSIFTAQVKLFSKLYVIHLEFNLYNYIKYLSY